MVRNAPKLSNTSVIENEIVAITCNDGYVLEGEATLTCTGRELFDNELPTCIPGKQI